MAMGIMKQIQFCERCGRVLQYSQHSQRLECSKHKEQTKQPPLRERVGRYSGYSKSQNAWNDYK